MSSNPSSNSRLHELLQAGTAELEATLAASTDIDEKLSAAVEAAVDQGKDPSPLDRMLRNEEASLHETLTASTDVEERLTDTLSQAAQEQRSSHPSPAADPKPKAEERRSSQTGLAVRPKPRTERPATVAYTYSRTAQYNEALPEVPEVRVVGLPQLTSGFDLVERLDLSMHLKVHGPLEPLGGEQLAKLAEAINLKGRGGAGFPFHKKLRSVTEAAIKRGVRPVVVVNGSESDPSCRKDTVLINRAPHLILDGALLVAEALGARTLVVGVTRESTQRSMEAALAERGLSNSRRSALRASVQRNPVRMVTGSAASLIRSIDGGPAIPPGRKVSASQSGVGGAPTLLSNAETFAQLAIAARIGRERYGNTGLYDEPGTVMLTVSGAVARPMVIEVPTGVPLRYVLQLAGAPPVPQGVLTGGYHGKWIDAATVNEAIVSRNSLDAVGGALGAGAILPISQETCPLGEALQVAKWLAEESAGQCGPCYLGLPAAARGLEDILNGGGPAALETLKQVARNVKRRGACSHPDGSAMFLESMIKVFTDDLAAHVLGNGCGRPVEGVLPLFEGGRTSTGIPGGAEATEEDDSSRQKIYVDWTLCRGHGLCADILPEVFELGADGFPTVTQAQVPRYAEAKALHAVGRCPALALRIEEGTRAQDSSRNNLPVLSQGRRAREKR